MFRKEEKGKLLVKNIARTATRHLVGQHVLFGGYLQYWTTLYLLNLPINRQLKVFLEVTGARKNRACERDTRGEREHLPKRPMKIIFLAFCECWKFLLVKRLLREVTVQWNPVSTDTKGTCHSVRIIRVSVLSGLSKKTSGKHVLSI